MQGQGRASPVGPSINFQLIEFPSNPRSKKKLQLLVLPLCSVTNAALPNNQFYFANPVRLKTLWLIIRTEPPGFDADTFPRFGAWKYSV